MTVSEGRAEGSRSVVADIREAIVRGDFVPNQRLVEADSRGIERHHAIQVLERMREREVAQAACRQERLS